MSWFFCKLVPPRPTFIADMSAAELALMQAHGAYWAPLVASGQILAMGPVADPKGGFGAMFIEGSNQTEIATLTADDPVILADKGFVMEISSMPQLATRFHTHAEPEN